jgi:glucokinase
MTKSPVTLGIDLGGTKIDIGIVDPSGKILRRELIKTNKSNAQFVVNDIKNAFEKLKSTTETIDAAGVGMAGQIEAKTGRVHFAPNLGWKNYELGAELENALQIPVKITNDVRAAAWGEWLYGAGQGCNDMVCLFVGTGIGAGIVSGGKMLVGASNAAGEVGHMTIDLNGPLCSCGNRGCFEALASGWAIARRAKEVMTYDSVESKKLLDLTGGTVESLTGRDVIDAYRSKASVAVRVIEEVKTALVAGVANLINTFNPSKLILGGGIITGAPVLVDSIRDEVSTRALKSSVENLEIVQAQLKGDAGVAGAAAFVKDVLGVYRNK